MKKNAFATLIKDVLMAGIAWVVGLMILTSGFDMTGPEAQYLALYFTCIPFGWRWASNIITAVSLKGIGIKLLISLFLGMVAIVIVLGGDVIRCLGSLISSVKKSKKAAALK